MSNLHTHQSHQSSASKNSETTTLLQSRPFQAVNPQLDTTQHTIIQQAPSNSASEDAESESPTQADFDFGRIKLFSTEDSSPEAPQFPVQAKLTLGQPNDKYEQEADRLAAQVVQHINSPQLAQRKETIQRKPNINPISTEEQYGNCPDRPMLLQRQSSIPVGPTRDDFETNLNQARGNGSHLAPGVRTKMEQAMGADFSGVKIHTDATANRLSQSIQAKAFTTGNDIFFKPGEYSPSSRNGQELLAHELTHVMQQGGATVQRKSSPCITQSEPSISRVSNNTIQRVLMSVDSFHENVGKHAPIISTAIPELKKKLVHFHKNLHFLAPSKQLDHLKVMEEDAKAWIQDGDHKKHTKTIDGLDQFIKSLEHEIQPLEEQVKKSQGTKNQALPGISAEIESIYDNKIYIPICAAIKSKLGLGRREIFRSKKLNLFRKKLKDTARKQAYIDIDQVAADVMKNEGQEESEAMQHYYATKAKIDAYTQSKTFVNDVVEELAKTITKAAVPKEESCKSLTKVAEDAASNYQDPTEAMTAKAAEIVKEQVGRTKGKDASAAIQTAREITKGAKTDDTNEQLKQKIEANIGKDDHKFARTTLHSVIEADTLDKGFRKLGKMIDWAVPNSGSSCEVDIQFKVPVGETSGTYFTTRVLGSAEKDSEEGKQDVEAKLDVSAGLGWTALGVIDANVQAGFFFKSKAETSQKAMQQVSYAFYRKLQTENKDSRVANKIWGMKGAEKTGMAAGDSAETWAAAMEELLFYERNKNGKAVNEAYVEVGWLVAGQGKLNAGNATVEGEAKYRQGIRYSAESLGEGLGKFNKSKDELKQAGAGHSRKTIELKSDVEINAISGFGCGLEGSVSFNGKGVYEVEVEASAEANTQWDQDVEVWQTVVPSIGASVLGLIKKIADRAQSKDSSFDKTGIVADIGFPIMNMKFADAGQSLGAKLADSTPTLTDKVTGQTNQALGVKQGLKLAVSYSAERAEVNKKFDQELEVSISRIRELGYDHQIGSGGLKAKAETAEKLVRVKYSWGNEKKFSGNFFGKGDLGR